MRKRDGVNEKNKGAAMGAVRPGKNTLRLVNQLAKPIGPGVHPSAGVFFDAVRESGDRGAGSVEHAVIAVLPESPGSEDDDGGKPSTKGGRRVMYGGGEPLAELAVRVREGGSGVTPGKDLMPDLPRKRASSQ